MMATNYPVEIGFPSFLNTNMHTECVGKDKVTDNMCTVQYINNVLCLYTAVGIVRLLLTPKRCI